jgi:hypothetical protein
MHAQKNWFKVALMTLAAVGLTLGAFTLSAQAHDQKEDKDYKIVILYNQFEGGTKVKVDGLKLLCVPTHKEIYEDDGTYTDGQKDDGTYTDGQKDDGKGEKPKDDYTYDHLACYKVKEVKDYQGDDKKGDDDKKY